MQELYHAQVATGGALGQSALLPPAAVLEQALHDLYIAGAAVSVKSNI
jgi:hypothetical protein